MTVTIDELDATDLDKDIPCELVAFGKPCGKPAVCRIRATCVQHGWGTVWICKDCRELVKVSCLIHDGCWIYMEVRWL